MPPIFFAKLATRRGPSPSGVFINDVHEPSTRIPKGPVHTHPDAQPVPRGSDPDAKPTLGGSDPSASMTMLPTDVTVLALDQTDW